MEGIAEHLLLMIVGVAGIGRHQAEQGHLVPRAEQVAEEKHGPGSRHADHLAQDRRGFRNVMHDAVRDDRTKSAVGERESLGIHSLQGDALRQARTLDIVAADAEHVFRQVDGNDAGTGVLPAKGDGDLRRACADVEDGVGAVPDFEEVLDEDAVDAAVVHRVVVASFLGRVHDLGFEDAGEHGENARLAGASASAPPAHAGGSPTLAAKQGVCLDRNQLVFGNPVPASCCAFFLEIA